jgi:hypothetical protein
MLLIYVCIYLNRGRSVERTMWLMNETHITGDKNASAYDELSETYDQVSM